MNITNNNTAPCGLDCFNCEIFENNITEDMKINMAQKTGAAPEMIVCKGCREQGGCKLFPGTCKTLQCIVDHNVDFCFDCTEFPCSKLQPVKEGADSFPHNYKLFNLCRIKAIGIAAWMNEAKDIRQKYFTGKFVIGEGPVLD